MRGSTRAAIAVVGLVTLSACGGSDDATDTQSAGTDVGTANSEVASDDDASSATTPTDDSGTDTGSTLISQRPNDVGGTCEVEVTGDKSASWTAGGTVGDVLVSYWLPDDQMAVAFPEGGMGIILNCVGSDGNSVGFITGTSATEENVPLAPGTFALTPAGSADGDLFGVVVALADSATNWGIVGDGGSLELTTFDENTIAGTFTVPMEDSLAEFAGTPSEGNIVVTGSFEFPRPAS